MHPPTVAREYGHHRGMHQDQGWHHRGFGGPGCGAFDNLSEDEIKKLDAERTTFFEATKDLRRKIYQKRLELASELAKENPDAAAAAALQTELSDFKAQMAQKRLEHILRVQKINPDLGRGFWGGGPYGPRNDASQYDGSAVGKATGVLPIVPLAVSEVVPIWDPG